MRKLTHNNNAIAPLVWVGILGVIALVGTVATVTYFSQPDVTYNISEGGLFSIAGLEITGLEFIILIVIAIFVFVMLFRNMGKRK